MTKDSKNDSRTEKSKKKMIQVAKSAIKSSLAPQMSPDTGSLLSLGDTGSNRLVQADSPSEVGVSATSGPASRRALSKTPALPKESSVGTDAITLGLSSREDYQDTSDNYESPDDSTARKTRKRKYRSPSEEAEDEDNNTASVTEEEYPGNDRSFSVSASSTHDYRSRGRQTDNSRLSVPSNMCHEIV